MGISEKLEFERATKDRNKLEKLVEKAMRKHADGEHVASVSWAKTLQGFEISVCNKTHCAIVIVEQVDIGDDALIEAEVVELIRGARDAESAYGEYWRG